MAEVIRMPRMSDTMTEGVFVAWNKKVGDFVAAGDILAEVETDKATMDLESYNEGVLLYIGVEAGSAALVDSIIAIVGEKGEDFKSILEEESKKVEVEAASNGQSKEAVEAKIEVAEEKVAAPKPPPAVSEKVVTVDGRIKASPLAKRLAEEKRI